MPGNHHPFSPSSLHRRMLCPGSYRMEDGLPDRQSDEADEGTRLHSVMAGKDDGAWMNVEQQNAVETAFVRMSETGIKPNTMQKEVHLSLWFDGEIITEGTPDVFGIECEGHCVVVDYKFGRSPVLEPKDNIQLAAYAAMVMQHFGYGTCTAHVIQPRAVPQWTSFCFTDFAGICQTIQGIIAKCKREDAPLVPGKEQCKHCRALATCPAVHGQCMELVRAAETAALQRATPDQLAELYDRWKLAERFGKAIEQRIREVCEEIGECSGLVLQKRKGHRAIKDPDGAFGVLSGALTAEEFLSCSTVSPSQLEDVYIQKYGERGASGRLKKGESVRLKRQLADLLGDCVTTGEPSMVLTRKKENN